MILVIAFLLLGQTFPSSDPDASLTNAQLKQQVAQVTTKLDAKAGPYWFARGQMADKTKRKAAMDSYKLDKTMDSLCAQADTLRDSVSFRLHKVEWQGANPRPPEFNKDCADCILHETYRLRKDAALLP